METTNSLNNVLFVNTIVEQKDTIKNKNTFVKKIKEKLFKLNVYHWFDSFSELKISLEEMDHKKI